MSKFRKYGVAFLLIAAMMLVLVGCGGSGDGTTEKTYVIGSETTFPPFEMVDDKGGYTGFDIELIRAIAEAEGFKIEIQSQGFDGLIPALEAGNIDAAVSAMTITDKRKLSVDFSDPYYVDPNGGLQIALRADQEGLDTPDLLAGKTIGVQIATTGADYANEIAKKYPDTKVKTFNTVDLIFADLANKGCDAVINDRPVTQDYIDKGHPEVKLVGKLLTTENYGIAVKKGNTEVLDKINAGLKKVKESGKYDEIYNKYFGK